MDPHDDDLSFPPEHTLSALAESPQLYVRQEKEWAEILVDWETANRYTILTPDQQPVGVLAERGGGFWRSVKRLLLRSHRPLHVDLLSLDGQIVLQMTRPFFFFWSDLLITDETGRKWGSVRRRFSIFFKKYDLEDASGEVFARVSAPFWRLWTFPLKTVEGQRVGEISKKWTGLLREAFSDADSFLVNLDEHHWSESERGVILAAAISIDFDFFEENSGFSSVFDAISD